MGLPDGGFDGLVVGALVGDADGALEGLAVGPFVPTGPGMGAGVVYSFTTSLKVQIFSFVKLSPSNK